MITLTTPPQINSVLGGSAPVAYDKLVIGPFTLDPVTPASAVRGTLRLTSTANGQMQPMTGLLTINTTSWFLTVEVPQLDFYRQIQLSGPQITAVNTIIGNAQNSLEQGLIDLAIIAGTQSAGA